MSQNVLCDTCKGLGGRLFDRSQYRQWCMDGSRQVFTQDWELYADYRELISASQSCPLCKLILKTFELRGAALIDEGSEAESLEKLSDEDVDDEQAVTSSDESAYDLDDRNDTSITCRVFGQIDLERLPGFNVKPESLCLSYIDFECRYVAGDESVSLKLCAPPGSPAAKSGDIIGRPPLPGSHCDEAVRWLKNWLHTCSTAHLACKQGLSGVTFTDEIPTELPTRVIAVGNDTEQPRLVLSNGTKALYTTLSHCWGPPKLRPTCTTKESLANHLECITWSKLSKTFQDAVKITRSLGIHYLWIDSLCIIQGDVEDWSREAARMSDVYERSYLTIAASDAEHSGQGCFVDRGLTPESVDIPYSTANGNEAGTCSISEFLCGDTSDQGWLDTPLMRRGWVLQEGILSRRTVQYTKRGLVWFCNQLSGAGADEQNNFYLPLHGNMWEEYVQEFTARNLTFDTDKLPAIQGVANALTTKTGDTYYKGHFIQGLPGELLWSRYLTPLTRPISLKDHPTWSWASTSGALIFHELLKKGDKIDHVWCEGLEIGPSGTLAWTGPRCTNWHVSQRVTHTTSLEDYWPSHREQKLFEQTYLADELPHPIPWRTITNEKGADIGLAIYDDDEAFDHGPTIFALLVRSEAVSSLQWAMMLQRISPHGEIYRRVGICIVEGKLWKYHSDDVPMERFCVV